jgi:hypothetical protein
VIGLALLWGWLLRHAYLPTATSQAITAWPAESRLSVPAEAWRVVLFAHPLCPCTRATLNELDRLTLHVPAETSFTVVFNTNGLKPSDVEASPTLTFAQKMPSVTTVPDPDGQETDAFQATVSGEVFAFDPSGILVFHGGITPSRGHEGGSIGAKRLFQLLKGKTHQPYNGPVFGCRLPLASTEP